MQKVVDSDDHSGCLKKCKRVSSVVLQQPDVMFRIHPLIDEASVTSMRRPAKKMKLWDDEASPSSAATVAIPGDAIADASEWMRGHGTLLASTAASQQAGGGDEEDAADMLESKEVLASVAGRVQRLNRLVTVQALRSRYRPEVGDLVVARIAEVCSRVLLPCTLAHRSYRSGRGGGRSTPARGRTLCSCCRASTCQAACRYVSPPHPLRQAQPHTTVQRRKLESDELQMRAFFQEGDLLVAEVQAFFADGAMSLHTRSLKYGKVRIVYRAAM